MTINTIKDDKSLEADKDTKQPHEHKDDVSFWTPDKNPKKQVLQ